MIKRDYNQYKCYTWMEKEHRDSFDILAEHYGELLNRGCPVGDVLYTAHDFDKHCNDILRIISNIILLHCDEKMFSSKELYILHLSVLFHDISMAVNKNWKRDTHSKESAEYVKSEEENHSSPLNQEKEKNHLTHNDISAIRTIITAHSDIKDGTVDKEKNGIKNPLLTFQMNGNINGKAIAAILRLADELDITSDRLGSERFSVQLSPNIEDEKISIKHWERLHYFSMINFAKDDLSQLEIYCDDEYIDGKSDDISNVVSEIIEIYNKVKNELTVALNLVFNKPINSKIAFRCDKLKIITENNVINKELESLSDPISSFDNSKNSILNIKAEPKSEDRTNVTNTIGCDYPQTINEQISDKLKNHINSNDLLDGGHYKINRIYCSRDWIDTNEIIETREICDKCIESFAEHCTKKEFYTNAIILGLDLEGSILASILAMKLHLPFQYIIPAKSEEKNSTNDIEQELPKDKNIIIVTDVICTYDTISKAIEKYNLKERIVAIYSLLYRDSRLNDKAYTELKSITFCINKDFPMEVHKINECNYEKCIAKNKRREA